MEMMKSKAFGKHVMKLISLFFAITLWFYVLNSEPLELEKNLVVEYLLPKGLAISNIVPKEVTVRLKGSRTFMRNLFLENEKVYVNLKNQRIKSNSEMEHVIGHPDIPAPFGIQVLSVEPKRLEIKNPKGSDKKSEGQSESGG